MNAVLQCLSHTDLLAEYFVLDKYKIDLKRRNKINSRKFGTKGELTEQLANVLKALWMCRNESEHSTSFKAVVDRYGTQFRSSTQHDAQEFLLWLMDKVHEDLNTATKRRYKSMKNNYGRSDEIIAAETLANHIRCNNSFVQAVFQAQFRSSLTCPQCKKQSNTFDPFHCISVQLPQLTQQVVFVTVLYAKQHPKQVKLGLTIPAGSPIITLRRQLNSDTGIPSNRIVLAEINETGFSRIFYDYQPTSILNELNLYCIEIPDISLEQTTDLMLMVTNVKKYRDADNIERFGTPFCLQVNRDCSYIELQKKLLKEMSTSILKPEVFGYTTPLGDMFQIRLQDPSADPDTYLERVEHPLFTEIIDMALSLLSADSGPPHIKLLLEWKEPEKFFNDMTDPIVEHESVARLKDCKPETSLNLEQCLEHYTKAETLSAEDAWRCPHCQQYLPVVKTLGLWSLPDILVIHFKRFRQHHDKGPDAAKLTTMVKFPLTSFDMSPHLADESKNSNDSLNSSTYTHRVPWKRSKEQFPLKCPKDTRYDLYAVCYHQGDTLETGHYTAACKNPYDQQWYKFDDQRVSHVPSENIEKEIVNNEAYILFYQRRKLENNECSVSGSSTNSIDHWVSKIAPLSAIPNFTQAPVDVTSVMEVAEIEIQETPKEIKPIIIEKTDETIIVDVESLEQEDIKSLTCDTVEDENKVETVITVEINTRSSVNSDIIDETEDVEDITEFESVKPTVVTTPTKSKCPLPIKEEEEAQKELLECEQSNDNEESPEPSLQTSSSSSAILRMRAPSISQILRSNGCNINVNSSTNSNYATITSTASNQIREALSASLKNNSNILAGAFGGSCSSGNSSLALSGSSHCISLRHSFSTNSNYKLKDYGSETLSSMLRNNSSSCSRDTLIFIDQQNGHHRLLDEDDDDEDTILGSRSLWISPVTPHKLITVSPKN